MSDPSEPIVPLSEEDRLRLIARNLFEQAREESAREDTEYDDWRRRYRKHAEESARPTYLRAWAELNPPADGDGGNDD